MQPQLRVAANSDPAVIRVAQRWMDGLAERPLTYSVYYHADQDLGELRRFWGYVLSVDPEAISMQPKSNSNQLAGRIWRSAHGVLTVWARETMLRARLQAWIDIVREGWGLH